MSLDAVLSTMRALILDAPAIPETETERIAWISEKYPGLNQSEVEDLARVHPSGWETYTSSIFLGEGSLLRSTHPVTMSILARDWKAVRGETFSRDLVPRLIHRQHPWKSTKTVDLAGSLCASLSNELHEFVDRVPGLDEMAAYEIAIVKTRKASGTRRGKVVPSSYKKALSGLQVDELLGLNCILLEPRTLLQFDYDVHATRERFFTRGDAHRVAPEVIPRGSCHVLLTRNDSYEVETTALSAEIFAVLKTSEQSTNGSCLELSTLAEALVEQWPDEDEQAVFARFLQLVLELRAVGTFRFPFENVDVE